MWLLGVVHNTVYSTVVCWKHIGDRVMDEMLCAGYANVEVTQSSNTSSTTMTTTTVSAAEDAQEPDDERKIINELLSRLEPPVVRRL